MCRQKFAAELEQLPWAKKDKRFFLNREEEYVGGLRVATQVWSKIREKTIDVEEALLLRLMIDFPGGLELHMGVCVLTSLPHFLISPCSLMWSFAQNLCFLFP